MKRRSLPSLNALRAFEAFSRHGRMSSAADELCVTHGAVSRQVRQLEQSLGVSLVEGPKTRLKLTPEGLRLAASLGTAFDDMAEAVDGLKTEAGRILSVSCLGTFAMRWLIPRLPDFLERHPQVQVSISESHAPVDFRRGDYDSAIRMAAEGAASEAETTVFLPHHHGPVMAPGLASPSLQRLGGLPRLHTRTYPKAWDDWQDNFGCRLPPPPSEQAFDHNYYLMEAAVAGLGAAIGSWPFVIQDVASGRLAAPFGIVEAHTRYVFLTPRGKAEPAAALFRDWLLDLGRATPLPQLSPLPAPSP